MYNPKLNHMCLKINCLVFCEDTGACTMKLFVQYQLTVCSFFYSEVQISLLLPSHVPMTVTWSALSMSPPLLPMSVVHCYK